MLSKCQGSMNKDYYKTTKQIFDVAYQTSHTQGQH